MTGLGIDTLRAWERRYRAIVPQRDARGRLYTDADVTRLRLLRDAVANGHAIGRIVALPDQELRELGQPGGLGAPVPETPSLRPGAAVLGGSDLLAALDHLDVAAIEARIAQAAALLKAPALLREVVVPALREIGDAWSCGRLNVAHEHMLSAMMRNTLGSLLHLHARHDVPDRMLFATPAGERHELGTLGAALIASSGGLGAVYLGPDLPAQDLVDIASTVDTDVVVIGVTAAGEARHAIAREVDALARKLPRDVELWIGGPAAEELAAHVEPRALSVPDYDVFEWQLSRIGARF
jgi:methanogenic corrinoid protein MtbC1